LGIYRRYNVCLLFFVVVKEEERGCFDELCCFSDEEFETMLAAPLKAAFYVTRQFLPKMKAVMETISCRILSHLLKRCFETVGKK
jgi:NAD(P)-dependent dehydrogenase (short-subunit alcohol dehydrogenase family)